MSLSSDSAVLTMPVQPANTNGSNGFGFGNDGAWWIIILFLFAFCGGWGGNWGGNGSAYHSTSNATHGLSDHYVVRIRLIPGNFIKTVDHTWAFITTAVPKVKQPVDLIDRDKECIAVKDGIGLFKCSAAAFQCSPVFRKCSCRLLCSPKSQF